MNVSLGVCMDESVGGDQLFIDRVTLESLEADNIKSAEEFDGGKLAEDEAHLREALQRGVNLRTYAAQIEEELTQVENASIDAYIAEDENLRNLHTDIRSCADILGQMETMLVGFHKDLAAKSEEISELQTQSLSLNLKLKNRRQLEGALASLVDQMVIPPELVQKVFTAELDENYASILADLQAKLMFVAAGKGQPASEQSKSYHEMAKDVAVLRAKAVARVREWLLTKINLLKKPGTNIQIIQRDVLLKYRAFYAFLAESGSEEVAEEVIEAYTTTMDRLYAHQLSTYTARLLQLCGNPDAAAAGETDVMAQLPTAKKKGGALRGLTGKMRGGAAAAAADAADAVSVYSIADRSTVLEGLSQPPMTAQECETQLDALEELQVRRRISHSPICAHARTEICASIAAMHV